MTDFNTVASIIGGLGAGSIAFVGGGAWVIRKIHRFNTKFDDFLEDWNGSDERPGVPHRPGVMERLSQQDNALKCIEGRVVAVEAELNPNGGKSVKDAVSRVDGHLNHIRGVVDDLDRRVTNLERPQRVERRLAR